MIYPPNKIVTSSIIDPSLVPAFLYLMSVQEGHLGKGGEAGVLDWGQGRQQQQQQQQHYNHNDSFVLKLKGQYWKEMELGTARCKSIMNWPLVSMGTKTKRPECIHTCFTLFIKLLFIYTFRKYMIRAWAVLKLG